MSKPVAWSYSALGSFITCPLRYYETKVAKRVAEPQTDQTRWGNQVHKALELRIGQGTPLPPNMVQYEPIAAKIADVAKGKKVVTEQKLGLTKSLKPTTFFAKDVWLRAILDLKIENGSRAFVGDWKTGKKNPDSDQLKLFAAVTFAISPWINEVQTSFIWLQSGETTAQKFVRDDAAGIWQEFLPKVRRLEQAYETNNFPARPSGLCRSWCPVHTCIHNGNYRASPTANKPVAGPAPEADGDT